MKKLIFLLLLLNLCANAQVERSSELYQTLKAKDSLLFNVGYNTCDITQFELLLSEQFEFYHDQAGITASKTTFVSDVKNKLCQLSYQPKRVLLENSLAVFPLKKNGVLYGAIQTGEHQFYAIEKNKPEYLTSTAKFTHVWVLENGNWKLTKALSYDHKNADK